MNRSKPNTVFPLIFSVLLLASAGCATKTNHSAAETAEFKLHNLVLNWATEPHSVFSSEVKMSVERPGIEGALEYRFICVAGGAASSDWQESSAFRVSDLRPDTEYTFVAEVRRRGADAEAVLAETALHTVRTQKNANPDPRRYTAMIDRAFAAGEIELIPIRVSGDKDNRINVCVINRWMEGRPNSYNRAELREEFLQDVQHAFRAFIPGDTHAISPHPEYEDFFNLYAIWWPDVPAYDYTNGFSVVDYDEIRDRLFLPWNREGRGWVTCLAMLNSEFGGGGAVRVIDDRVGNAMIAGNEVTSFIHEFAHTAAGLPDEYCANGVWGRGGEGSTTTLDFKREDVKWRAWIEPDTEVPTPYTKENLGKVGVFKGAAHRLHNIYRSTGQGCIMGAGTFVGSPTGFSPIGIQRTVCRLYIWVDPFDKKSPPGDELRVEVPGRVAFSIETIENGLNTQELSWFRNGEKIAGDVRELTIDFDEAIPYTIECRLIDRTDFIRPDLPYVDYPQASVKWFVNGAEPDDDAEHEGIGSRLVAAAGTAVAPVVESKGSGGLKVSTTNIIPSTGGFNNGSVRIETDSGKPPYSYHWADGEVMDEPRRNFLRPGEHRVTVIDAGAYQKELRFKVPQVSDFEVGELRFESSGGGTVQIANPRAGYDYLWYEEDLPQYVPRFPNGKFYGRGVTEDGRHFKATATVVENRGGVFLKDTEKNDFGSWIALKLYLDGADALPTEFSIDTTQEGRFDPTRTIRNRKTKRIVYDNNFEYRSKPVDVTWNGVIRDGYLQLNERGLLNSEIKLYYSSAYSDPKQPLAKGTSFNPTRAGNYFVAAVDVATQARSTNRVGVAITAAGEWRPRPAVHPDAVSSANLRFWIDGEDLNADGVPDGKLLRRGSANGGHSKAGDVGLHWFNYFPNRQNGKPVLGLQYVWIQSLTEAVTDYQTIIMVRNESDLTKPGVAPWQELDQLIGLGAHGEKLFSDDISAKTREGKVWINGEPVDAATAVMPRGFYIAVYEFADPITEGFRRTNGYFEGDLAEVLVFDAKLSQSDREGVEEYLYRKWISGAECEF